jgi:hypothetical protein
VCIEDAAREAISAADAISKLNEKNLVKDFSDHLNINNPILKKS